ncbi:MAG: hypothetical protein HFJ43_03245 [Clostridia bacterium]|nr:hypothetical protein [Clostridia bacterium]
MKGSVNLTERSLKVLDTNKTFFGKLSNTLSKLLVPTRIGINGLVITLKRNNLLKTYEAYINLPDNIEKQKKDTVSEKYEEAYSLYLEAIDRHIMDTIYKKVKSGIASEFEGNAMAQYYEIINLKNSDYNEYKYRKQKYLIDIDYESLKVSDKSKLLNRYEGFYISKMDTFYKAILKNYSVSLAGTTNKQNVDKDRLFNNIFTTIDEYIKNIISLKIKNDSQNSFDKIQKDYEEYEKFDTGKLKQKEEIEKKIIMLNISRVVFTHSLPLVASEKCYERLIYESRLAIINEENYKIKEELYLLMLDLLKIYDEKLLSTKIYWEDLKEKENFKTFWNLFTTKKDEQEKEIMLLSREVSLIDTKENDEFIDLVKYYKDKLVKFGSMRAVKNSCKTYKNCRKIK